MVLTFDKPRTFYFHYNKPSTQRAGRVQMSAHVDGKCLIGDAIYCTVACYSKENKRQLRLVMKGKCTSVEVKEDGIYIQ